MVVTPGTQTERREAIFCRGCALLGSAREAARLAGYPEKTLDKTLRELLLREDIRDAIAEELRGLSGDVLRSLALRGLCRLAFGGPSDAVRLSFLDEAPPPGALAEWDLFCLSEVRRPKSGGCEIRLYDRMKALELLLQYGGSPQSGSSSFLEALRETASGGGGEPGAV